MDVLNSRSVKFFEKESKQQHRDFEVFIWGMHSCEAAWHLTTQGCSCKVFHEGHWLLWLWFFAPKIEDPDVFWLVVLRMFQLLDAWFSWLTSAVSLVAMLY